MGLNLNELKNRFHEESIYATLQCGGNRRNEFSDYREVKGGKWDTGAIRLKKKQKKKKKAKKKKFFLPNKKKKK